MKSRQRQLWFQRLTPAEKSAWFEKKRAEKRARLAKTGFASNCTVFPRVDDSNRTDWQDKVLRKNPWLDAKVFAT